jgi:hypothetical protein
MQPASHLDEGESDGMQKSAGSRGSKRCLDAGFRDLLKQRQEKGPFTSHLQNRIKEALICGSDSQESSFK